MSDETLQPRLGASLRAERRRQRLSLRDLADQIGVSFNTLSRVERGHVPELKTYEQIVRWLGSPGQALFPAPGSSPTTPELIAKHLYTDNRLDDDSASTMLALIQDMYAKLAAPTPAFAVHLRSSQTFIPEVGNLLSGALQDMYAVLVEEGS